MSLTYVFCNRRITSNQDSRNSRCTSFLIGGDGFSETFRMTTFLQVVCRCSRSFSGTDVTWTLTDRTVRQSKRALIRASSCRRRHRRCHHRRCRHHRRWIVFPSFDERRRRFHGSSWRCNYRSRDLVVRFVYIFLQLHPFFFLNDTSVPLSFPFETSLPNDHSPSRVKKHDCTGICL